VKPAPLLALALLAGCTAKSVSLVEGYCTHGEAARCYYDEPVMDGF
jgi:hypothetical protein